MKKLNIFKKKKGRFYFIIILLYFFIAIFASVIANEKPLFISINGKMFFPAFSSSPYIDFPDSNGISGKMLKENIDWKNISADLILFAPVCWSPTHSDLLNVYVSPFDEQHFLKNGKITEMPFRFRHFLGAGKTGNDVLSGLIHGLRTSLSIGFFSMTIAAIIGILAGGISGFFGDDKLKVRRGSIILSIIMIIPAWFFAFHLRDKIIVDSFSQSTINGFLQVLLSLIIFKIFLLWTFLLRFSFLPYFDRKIYIPTDSIISRFIEIFLSLPRLILILTLAAIIRPSVTSIIIIIGLTSWTEMARIVRAQVLQLREMNYISAATSMGATTLRILFRHLMPNSISQVVVVWTFGIAAAILIETGLSFLGIGVPAGTATWGSLMFEARENYQAWWLVIFTGTAIFLLLSSLYLVGNKFKKG